MKVLIAGGTGLVGSRLSHFLTQKGYEVSLLSRSAHSKLPYKIFQWDVKNKTIDQKAIEWADYIINLAGAGIADQLWTKSRKKLIIDSRVDSTLLLKTAIEKAKNKPKAYISASANGYYGDRGEQVMFENSTPGKKGFLAKSVVAWEKAIDQVAQTGVRTAGLRIGIVLSTKGGAMEKMLLSFKVKVGTYFGDGSQWYSWIHVDDLCRMFIFAMENEQISGYYNAVAPNPVTNKELTQKLSEALGGSNLVVPAPSFVLKMGMGEMSSVVLNSTKVSVEKIQKAGFKFEFNEVLAAIRDLLENKN